jgi:hypothetical protein
MVRNILVALLLVMSTLALAPQRAMAGCTTTLLDCFGAAARIDNFWYRTAAGLDCELDYAECVREKVIGA